MNRPLTFNLACLYMGKDSAEVRAKSNSLENGDKIAAELFSKLTAYIVVGFSVYFFVPVLFKALGIERETFFTEM